MCQTIRRARVGLPVGADGVDAEDVFAGFEAAYASGELQARYLPLSSLQRKWECGSLEEKENSRLCSSCAWGCSQSFVFGGTFGGGPSLGAS